MVMKATQQYLSVEAYDSTTNQPKTGDAGNITIYYGLDGNVSSLTPIQVGTVTEWSGGKLSGTGAYLFQVQVGETNGDTGVYIGKSTTANTFIRPKLVEFSPAAFTTPFISAGGGGVIVTTNQDKTGYSLSVAPPTASAIASAVWAFVIEGSFTAVQYMRLFASALLGKASGLPTAPKYRDTADTKDRIVATTDTDGDRLNVTLDGT